MSLKSQCTAPSNLFTSSHSLHGFTSHYFATRLTNIA